MDFFNLPATWYGSAVGAVDFFVLDANQPEDPAQRRWLERALDRSQSRWRVVVFHQPAFSCSKHGGEPLIVERWVPLLQRYGVDLVLSGHDHNYQHFIYGGTSYVVTGGAGAPLYGLEQCPSDAPRRVAANDQVHHFLGVEVSSREMRVQMIDAEGKVLDSFSVED